MKRKRQAAIRTLLRLWGVSIRKQDLTPVQPRERPRRGILMRLFFYIRRFFAAIFGFIMAIIYGILEVIRKIFGILSEFFHALMEFLVVALILLGIVACLAGIYAAVQAYPEPFNAVGSAFTGNGAPAQFQGLSGGLTFFAMVLAGLLVFFALFIAMARGFARVIGSHEAMHPRILGGIIAYLLYGVSIVITIAIFSKFTAAVAAVIVFVLIPIVGSLISLILEESR
jgi:hypothetical protein